MAFLPRAAFRRPYIAMNLTTLRTGFPTALLIVASSCCGLSHARAQTFQFREGVSPNAAYQSGAVEVRQDQPDQNRDGGTGISVGVQGFANSTERGMFSFDLSSLAAGATLGNVSFSLTINFADSGSTTSPVPLELHLLTSSFDETTVTWNNQPVNTSLLSSLSAIPTSVTNGQTFTWNSTPAFVAAAQSAASAGGTLYFAIRLADANEATPLTRNLFFFDSNDVVAGTARPLLTVALVPEPSTWALIALGGILLFSLRYRELLSHR